jgi:fatty acid amide hydrolase
MLLSQRDGGLQAREYYERIVDKALLERKFKAAFVDNKFDAIVFPALGIPSPKHGDIGNLLPALSYSMLANLLHWPAGVVPVTRIADGEDDYDIASLSKQQQDSVAKLTKETMKGSKGLPIGVQVMTRKWQDELCLYVMAEIEREIPFAHRPHLNAA